jgi:hypothetical protein
MREGKSTGKGSLAMSDGRIFTGFFLNNTISGDGSLLIPIEGLNKTKNILLKANWSD